MVKRPVLTSSSAMKSLVFWMLLMIDLKPDFPYLMRTASEIEREEGQEEKEGSRGRRLHLHCPMT